MSQEQIVCAVGAAILLGIAIGAGLLLWQIDKALDSLLGR